MTWSPGEGGREGRLDRPGSTAAGGMTLVGVPLGTEAVGPAYIENEFSPEAKVGKACEYVLPCTHSPTKNCCKFQQRGYTYCCHRVLP